MRSRERFDDLILGVLLAFVTAALCLILLKGGATCLRLLDDPPVQFEAERPLPP